MGADRNHNRTLKVSRDSTRSIGRRQCLSLVGASSIGCLSGCLRLQGFDDSDDDPGSDTDSITHTAETVTLSLDVYNNAPTDIGNPDHREIRWEADRIILRAGDRNADPADVDGEMVEDEVSLGTVGATNTVDMSSVEEIRFEFRHQSVSGHDEYPATQDHSYLGIDEQLENIRRRPMLDSLDTEDALIDAFVLTVNESDTGRITEFLDVSSVTGPRNLGVGVQISSNWAQEVRLDVYDITGIDASNSAQFTVDI